MENKPKNIQHMENKPTAFFFHGTNISKIEDGTIKNVNKHYIRTSNVYLVNEPIHLLAGTDDKTGDLDLDEGDMFLTFSQYGENGWKYYRFKIQSKELAEFIIESEKRNAEQDSDISEDCCEAMTENN